VTTAPITTAIPVNTGGVVSPTLVNPPPAINTGGNTPAMPTSTTNTTQFPTAGTGGALPPTPYPTVQTGGPLPPATVTPVPPLPPGFSTADLLNQMMSQLTPLTGPTGVPANTPIPGMTAATGPTGVPANTAIPGMTAATGPSGVATSNIPQSIAQLLAQFAGQDPAALQRQDRNQVVQDSLNFFEDNGSRYMTNAARRGLEVAGSRGLSNSSIAAGAAQRGALESIQPFVQQAVDINNMREGQDFTSRENTLNRNLQRQLEATGMGMTAQGQREGQQFSAAQNSLDRVQQANAATYNAQVEAIARREGITFEAAQNQLDRSQQANAATYQAQIEAIARREGISFQAAQAALDRTQQTRSQQFDFMGNRISQQEQMAFQGEQAAQERQLRRDLQSDTTLQQDWLSSREFQRQFNAQLSMMPINNAFDMNKIIQQYALENPEVYTPDVISGMSNFFQNNMMSILSEFFPSMVNTAGGA
jgi:hypothetical protein